jgi:fatty-acyl-CoA synthase
MRGSYAQLWKLVAEALPDRTAIVAGEQRLSYAEFEDQAARFAMLLRERGIAVGDTIAFYMYNRAEYLIAFYGTLRLGAVPVSINFRYREGEVAALLDNCEAAALIYPATLADIIQRIPEQSVPEVLIEVSDDASWAPGAIAFDSLAEFEPFDSSEAPTINGTLMVYTGGTTGLPKAVVWDEPDLLEIQMFPTYGALGLENPETPAEVVAIAQDPSLEPTVMFALAPFIHATALFTSMNTFLLGGTVVLLPSPSLDTRQAVETIETENVSRIIVAGDAVAIPLMDAWDKYATSAQSKSLRSAMSSGMRFSDETKARIHALGDVTIIDILASTEGGPYALGISRSEQDLPTRFRLTPDAVVLDESRHEVQDQPGAHGILGFRGALPRGYFKDEKKTQETYPIINGTRYVMPGDYVKVEEDRYIELLGRGSSVVNTGGEKVYPAEVEEVLLDHPAITDAVVFGVADERWGERVVAMVAVNEPENVPEDSILEFVGQRLAGYKKPRQILLRESLDRGPTGKLDMRSIKATVPATR